MVAKMAATTAIKKEVMIQIKVTAVERLKIEKASRIRRREIIKILEQMNTNSKFNGESSQLMNKTQVKEMNKYNIRIIHPKEINFCQV